MIVIYIHSCHIHFILAIKMGAAICKLYVNFICKFYLASGLIHFQLFLSLQNHSFCYLILQIGVSYHIILIYNLNYEQTGL